MGLTEREQELISSLLDQQLTGEELGEAEALVRSSSEAARLLEDYRRDHEGLRHLPRVKAEPRHRALVRPPGRTARPRWLRAAAIVLLLGGLAFWAYTRRPVARLLALVPEVRARVAPGERKLIKSFQDLSGQLVASASTGFFLLVDGDGGRPSEAHLLLGYDFDGDGAVDRQETYHLRCDDRPGWQHVTEKVARLVKVEGSELQDFSRGVLHAELQCIHPENALLADFRQITLPNRTR